MRRSLAKAVLVFSIVSATPSPARAQAARDVEKTISFGGQERSYIVHPPPGLESRAPRPLVLILHGGGGHADPMIAITGFSDLSDRKGFFAVYPNGRGIFADRFLTWNSSAQCCGFALSHHVDDVGFLRALVRSMSAAWPIDRRRVYATGLSNGAMMAYRLGCEMSDVVAAIGPVAGALDVEPCRPAEPVSVIAFHGTADVNVLYNGGKPARQIGRNPRSDRSAAYAISFWTRADGCPPAAARSEKGSIALEVHSPCRNGSAVELVTIKGGGHAWPGGEKWAPRADEPTHEISATETMWEFFAAHPKP